MTSARGARAGGRVPARRPLRFEETRETRRPAVNIRNVWKVGCLAVAAIGMAALGNLGCDRSNNGGAGNASTSSKTYKLAFVTNNASDFWKIAAAGVHKYEKEGKVQVDIKMPPNGTVEEQNRTLEELTSQGYDGIAVSVIAPADQVPALNKAAAKTNLITFDSDSPKSDRLLYI